MTFILRSLFALVLVIPVSSGQALAQQDFWVNAEFGSNSNSGTSSSFPFKTVSFALSQVTQDESTLHLMGTSTVDYTRNNGETFPWALKQDVSLIAEPTVSNPNIIVDVGNAGTNAVEFDPGDPVSSSRISGITFQGGAVAVFAAPTSLFEPFAPTIEGCTFLSFSGPAMRFEPGAFVFCDPTIRNNDGSDLGGVVWFIIIGAVVDGQIEDNAFTNVKGTGFWMTGNTSGGVLTFQRNTLVANGWLFLVRIELFLGAVKILDNNISQTNENGIGVLNCPSWSPDSEIRGNDVSLAVYGIYVENTDNVSIIGNNSHDNSTAGIRGGWIVEDNNVHDNRGEGIWAIGAVSGPGPTVANNTCTDNGANGIRVSFTKARILGNTSNQNGNSGILIGVLSQTDGDETLVEGNSLFGNIGTGLTVHGAQVDVHGNTIGGNGGAGIQDFRCDGNQYSGNVIHNHPNSSVGAVEFLATTVTVAPEFFHNTVANNGGPGINSFLALGASTPFVVNSILWGNNGLGMDVVGLDAGEYAFCDLEDDPNPGAPWANISLDPQFVAAFDYHLEDTSPCRDAGTNLSKAWDTDMDWDPRVLDGDQNGSAVSDMGADEVSKVSLSVSSASGTYQQGTDITLVVTGPAGAPCRFYAAADPFGDPYASFPGFDHPFFGTVLLDIAKLVNVPDPGLVLDGSGNLSVTTPLPGGAMVGMHIVMQATVGSPAFGWGQITPAVAFVITP